MPRLDGKVALITGAGNGMGQVASVLFAREGARIVVADFSEAGGAETVAAVEAVGGEAAFVKVDVANPDQVSAMIDFAMARFGALNVLYNNAGIFPADDGGVTETPEPTWDRVMEVNLKGVWLGCKYGIPAMLASGGGAIVNMASILGSVGFAQSPAYVAAKHGVVGLTKTAGMEYAKHGIRINSVGPGFIDTPLLSKNLDVAVLGHIAGLHPIGRLGTSDEVAALTCFLLSDEAAFITGSYHLVDGGYTAQ